MPAKNFLYSCDSKVGSNEGRSLTTSKKIDNVENGRDGLIAVTGWRAKKSIRQVCGIKFGDTCSSLLENS